MTKEFIGFLKQYGIIGLAMAVIIGGKVNTVDFLVVAIVVFVFAKKVLKEETVTKK